MNIQRNLGLGDGLILAAAVAQLSFDDEIEFPCLPRDFPTFESIFIDCPNVVVYPVNSDGEMRTLGGLKTGFAGGEPNGKESLDEWFYRQLNLPIDTRWRGCPIADAADSYPQEPVPDEPYIFVHDDIERPITSGINGCLVVRPRTVWGSILECKDQVERAIEVHTIPSCMKEFVSAVQPRGALFLHQYARQPFNKILDSTKSPHHWNILE